MSVFRSTSYRRVLWAILASWVWAAAARAGQPVASFTFDPATPNTGATVTFTDTSTENPTSWLWNFGDPTAGVLNTSELQNPFFTYNLAGTYTVTLTVSNSDGLASTTHTVAVSDSGLPQCVPAAHTLCVGNGRFSVSADWTKPDGTSGQGDAVQLTSDSGYFWFFQASNTEVVVKVLNGCSITGAYWVFAAGLTNVQVVLNVKDEQTGVIYTNTNAQGVAYVPVQDTGALPTSCP
jgi:PKD repeat protein